MITPAQAVNGFPSVDEQLTFLLSSESEKLRVIILICEIYTGFAKAVQAYILASFDIAGNSRNITDSYIKKKKNLASLIFMSHADY